MVKLLPHLDETVQTVQLPPIRDLRHLSAEDQYAHLQAERERAMHEAEVARTVFVLRGETSALLGQILRLRIGADDIDGTVTGVGEDRIYDAAMTGLRGLEQTGIHNVGVTGRHNGQIDGMYAAHGDDLSYKTFLLEQGGAIKHGREKPVPYLGTQQLVKQMEVLRRSMSPFLDQTAAAHNVDFIPTSGGGHSMMVSFDALQRGTQEKITDRNTHAEIFDRFANYWSGRIAGALKAGSSSTGTFELSDPTIHKARAVREYATTKGVALDEVVFSGDSGNDTEIFETEGPLKVVVVNSHTGLNLTRNAHFATVGTGNAGPAKKLFEMARRLS